MTILTVTNGSDEGPPCLSLHLAVLRSGQHLSRIAERLRDLEAVIIASPTNPLAAGADIGPTRRSRMQALDLMIQELTGLSDILVAAAPRLTDRPDPLIDALVDLPRLQSLSRALRDLTGPCNSSEIVLF